MGDVVSFFTSYWNNNFNVLIYISTALVYVFFFPRYQSYFLSQYRNIFLLSLVITIIEAQASALVSAIGQEAFRVAAVTRSEKKRNPAAPFTTSTLQQEASRKLGFSARKTMTVAQKLYEGIEIGEGMVGLITYMRTDSVALSEEATSEAREIITRAFGPEYALAQPRVYKSKAKNAQEAHEAIRPTAIANTPEKIKSYLS
jgi:DNA topoisomerase-1